MIKPCSLVQGAKVISPKSSTTSNIINTKTCATIDHVECCQFLRCLNIEIEKHFELFVAYVILNQI